MPLRPMFLLHSKLEPRQGRFRSHIIL